MNRYRQRPSLLPQSFHDKQVQQTVLTPVNLDPSAFRGADDFTVNAHAPPMAVFFVKVNANSVDLLVRDGFVLDMGTAIECSIWQIRSQLCLR